MSPRSHTHPAVFLATYALVGLILHALVWWAQAPGVSMFLLVGGVVLGALWYTRRVYTTSVLIFLLLLAPVTMRLSLSPSETLAFFAVTLTGLLILVELIARLVRDIRVGALREQAAQERFREILMRNPAVIYGLAQDPAEPAGYRITFLSENAQAILGLDSLRFRRPVNVIGLCSLAPSEAQVAWRNELALRGDTSFDHEYTTPDGRRLWLRDECRLVREASGALVEIVGHITDLSLIHI